MRAPTLLSIASVAALCSGTLATVTMNFQKSSLSTGRVRPRRLAARASIAESLINNQTGGDYIAQVSVGTPAQKITLAIDTGSSDVWLMASTADLCTDPTVQEELGFGGCSTTFDSQNSNTFKEVDQNGFHISYADGSEAIGDYISDTFSIGGGTIKALEMGLAYNVTLPTGIMGIGYSVNEASNTAKSATAFIYPSVMDQMVSQGLITTPAYSLYLDDLQASTGSIIFGGLDADKYHGSLLQLPVVPAQYPNGTQVYSELVVAMTSYGITAQSGNSTTLTSSTFQIPVVLDSGTTLTYLPTRLAETIFEAVDAYDDSQNSGSVLVSCSVRTTAPDATFNYGFGGTDGSANVTVSVPINELVFDVTGSVPFRHLPFSDPCIFGVMDGGNEGPYILGDTFLRSAYVVYDLKNNQIALAQTNFNSTTSSIVEFQATQTAIPDVSGVASSAQVTQTATGLLGNPGSNPAGTVPRTTTVIAAGTTATGSTKSKSAAAGPVPAFDPRGLLVLGFCTIFSAFGGAWLLA